LEREHKQGEQQSEGEVLSYVLKVGKPKAA